MKQTVSKFDALMTVAHVFACFISVLMLLSFSSTRFHDFGTHFRTPEVRRATERHTSVAHSDTGALESVSQNDVLPTFFAPTESVVRYVLPENILSSVEVRIPRLLHRLKLNPGRSSGQDPLLSA